MSTCFTQNKSSFVYPNTQNLVWEEFSIDGSVRAIELIGDQTVWYTGSNGQFAYTEDGGTTWYKDSLQYDSLQLEFRSIAVVKNTIYILSVGSPALLFKSKDKGKNWELVYREDDPKAFYDSMSFWDELNGIAIGDPTSNCMSVLITRDGGASWSKLNCDQLPVAAEGEAAFAASNTNVVTHGDYAWIVSGGAKARVFVSPDKGRTWSVYNTPINQGGKMTGIFSADFYNEKKGIIYGGDWEHKSAFEKSKAITEDGGQTWELIETKPGYMSCVQYIPNTKGQGIIACGSEGIALSNDGGRNWNSISNKGYYSIRIGHNGKFAWLSGKNKIGHLRWE